MRTRTRKTRTRRSTESGTGISNLRMSDATYALRRLVMGHLYHGRALLASIGITMPRIQIRITDTAGNCDLLGCASTAEKAIWITTHGTARSAAELRHTVLHELVHTLTGFEHDDACPLMAPCAPCHPAPVDTLDPIFLSYFNQ